MKKTTKKTAVKRTPLKLVKNAPAKKKSTKTLRSFWNLFANVKNHKFQQIIQEGNYLDEFVSIVEAMPADQFESFLQTNHLNLRECLKKFRLDRYYTEFDHLHRLITLSDGGRPYTSPTSTDDFLKRVLDPEQFEKLRSKPSWKKSVVEGNPAPYPVTQTELQEITASSLTDRSVDELFAPAKEISVDDALKLLNKTPRENLNDLKLDLESKESREQFRANLFANLEAKLNSAKATAADLMDGNLEPLMPLKTTPGISVPVWKIEKSDVEAPVVVDSQPELPPFLPPPEKKEAPEIIEVRGAKKLLDAFEATFASLKVARIATKRKAALQLEAFAKEGNEDALRIVLQEELKAKHQFMMIKKVRKALYERFESAPLDQADVAVFEASTEDMLEALQKALADHFDKMGPSEETVKNSWMTRSNRKYGHRTSAGYARRTG